ncbi:MAG: hypothetical protein RLP15_12320 [Cryomorphaceae bacterium]
MRRISQLILIVLVTSCASYRGVSDRTFDNENGVAYKAYNWDEVELYTMRTVMEYEILGGDLAVRVFKTQPIFKSDETRLDQSVVGEHTLALLPDGLAIYITPRFFLKFADMNKRFQGFDTTYVSNFESLQMGSYKQRGEEYEITFWDEKGRAEMVFIAEMSDGEHELCIKEVKSDVLYRGKQDLQAPMQSIVIDEVFSENFSLDFQKTSDRMHVIGKGPELATWWLRPFRGSGDQIKLKQIVFVKKESDEKVRSLVTAISKRKVTEIKGIYLVAETEDPKKRLYKYRNGKIIRKHLRLSSPTNQKR